MDSQENNQINTQTSAPAGTGQDASQAAGSSPVGTPTPPASSVPPPANPPPAGNLDQASGEKLDGSLPAKKDKKLAFLIIGLVLALIIMFIAVIFSGTLNKSNEPVIPTPQAQQIITPTPSDQEATSQTPITNQQDAANALGELDKANPDTVGADLSQNDQDVSSFSQ